VEKKELAELPVFRITCQDGRVWTTQDPGRGLITGKCADVGAVVIPQLKGLAARAPYFSNGAAGTVEELVDSYAAMGIRFGGEEKRDLVNYLLSL
jgi:cytochrome c peroxidase